MKKSTWYLLAVVIIIVLLLAFITLRLKNTNQQPERESSGAQSTQISGIVVPHHDLVKDLRAQLFKEVAKQIKPPQTIILVSPNHYDAGRGQIQTTRKVWSVLGGTISPENHIIDALVAKNIATDEPLSFTDEHGIYNILGDIHRNFPEAHIVPLILKQLSPDTLDALHNELLEACADCLLVASVDFSHYQPALLADLHDERTLRFLQNIDTKNLLTEAEVDSGSSLSLLARWAQSHNTKKFSLWKRTNSGVMYEDSDMETTTHMFGWYESGAQTPAKKEVSFTIAGDTMFARYVDAVYGKNFIDAFSVFGERVFWGADARIINLEGSITKEPIKEKLANDNVNFKFPPSITKVLSFLHINGASQANNHSDNAGDEGITTTRDFLGEIGVSTFSGPHQNDVLRVAYFKGEGLTLAVVGINLTYPKQIPDVAVPVISEIAKDPSMRIVVIPHWGIEYATKHSLAQEQAAHMWIDAGADMVVGAHPHVIQDTELYQGVPIIYSLGNFLFDQIDPTTQTGLIVTGTFTQDGLSWFAFPIRSEHFKPRLLVGAEKQIILNSLYIPFKQTSTEYGDIINLLK
ncbi:AmmeMemoRadiSam system protein B [Candidatus Parcubacteria bacterium]|nr:AmmeMemoRadiSam system protein B [Candidatus Parcubacteria bacterium]